MNDAMIVQLYWQRDEAALQASRDKYGSYLLRVARNILNAAPDSEECVNDVYLAAWNSIPPQRPAMLRTYLAKLTRRIAISRYRQNSTMKRGGGQMALSLDELAECLPSRSTVEGEAELNSLTAAINAFLRALPIEKRRAFLCRYWYLMSIKEIAALLGYSETKTANLLSRVRKELKVYLEKEDLLYG